MTSPLPTRRPYDLVKRAVDVVVAAIGLLLTAPLQAVLAYLVARKLGRPVLYRQRRPGLYGKPFTMVKFRTMREADPKAGLISDADRLTPFGSALRSTSLDELPTLWNVLRGDMSLIGPRPIVEEFPRHLHLRGDGLAVGLLQGWILRDDGHAAVSRHGSPPSRPHLHALLPTTP